jgi:hypothetical protein
MPSGARRFRWPHLAKPQRSAAIRAAPIRGMEVMPGFGWRRCLGAPIESVVLGSADFEYEPIEYRRSRGRDVPPDGVLAGKGGAMCWTLDVPLVSVRFKKHVLQTRRSRLARFLGEPYGRPDGSRGAEGGEFARSRAGALRPRGPVPSLSAGLSSHGAEEIRDRGMPS